MYQVHFKLTYQIPSVFDDDGLLFIRVWQDRNIRDSVKQPFVGVRKYPLINAFKKIVFISSTFNKSLQHRS